MALLHYATCPAICLRDFVAAQVASEISRCNMAFSATSSSLPPRSLSSSGKALSLGPVYMISARRDVKARLHGRFWLRFKMLFSPFGRCEKVDESQNVASYEMS